MAQKHIVQLIDDLDQSVADETVVLRLRRHVLRNRPVEQECREIARRAGELRRECAPRRAFGRLAPGRHRRGAGRGRPAATASRPRRSASGPARTGTRSARRAASRRTSSRPTTPSDRCDGRPGTGPAPPSAESVAAGQLRRGASAKNASMRAQASGAATGSGPTCTMRCSACVGRGPEVLVVEEAVPGARVLLHVVRDVQVGQRALELAPPRRAARRPSRRSWPRSGRHRAAPPRRPSAAGRSWPRRRRSRGSR